MLAIKQPLKLQDLARYPVPEAPAWSANSSRWAPVPHVDLASAVLKGAEHRGLRPANQAWQVSNDGHGLVGTIDFHPDERWPDTVVPSIALRHSNVGRHAVTIAIGAVVLVCTNGMLVGEVVVKHRHTKGLNLDRLVDEALDEFATSGSQTHAFIRRLRGTRLPPGSNERIMIEAARTEIVPWSMLKHVDNARHNAPPAQRNERAEPTAWALYNGFTDAIKRRSPANQYRSLRALVDLFAPRSLAALR